MNSLKSRKQIKFIEKIKTIQYLLITLNVVFTRLLLILTFSNGFYVICKDIEYFQEILDISRTIHGMKYKETEKFSLFENLGLYVIFLSLRKMAKFGIFRYCTNLNRSHIFPK